MDNFVAPIRAAKLPVSGAHGPVGRPAVFPVGGAREPDTGEEVEFTLKHLTRDVEINEKQFIIKENRKYDNDEKPLSVENKTWSERETDKGCWGGKRRFLGKRQRSTFNIRYFSIHK